MFYFFKNGEGISTSRKVAITGVTAAIYVVITLAFPLSFDALQFRLSEIMMLLIFIDPGYAPGLILGCAISNLFSPLGIIDVFVGTFSTVIASVGIIKSKNLFTASLWPTISCLIVALELKIIFGYPYIPTALSVMAGEFVVVTIIGWPLFNAIIKNKKLLSLLKIGK